MEAEAESEEAENTNNANPLQFVLDHVDQAVGPELGGRTMPSLPEDFGFPDVLNRNILTAKECQELFDLLAPPFFSCLFFPSCFFLHWRLGVVGGGTGWLFQEGFRRKGIGVEGFQAGSYRN